MGHYCELCSEKLSGGVKPTTCRRSARVYKKDKETVNMKVRAKDQEDPYKNVLDKFEKKLDDIARRCKIEDEKYLAKNFKDKIEFIKQKIYTYGPRKYREILTNDDQETLEDTRKYEYMYEDLHNDEEVLYISEDQLKDVSCEGLLEDSSIKIRFYSCAECYCPGCWDKLFKDDLVKNTQTLYIADDDGKTFKRYEEDLYRFIKKEDPVCPYCEILYKRDHVTDY
jgi:hypothetical protein